MRKLKSEKKGILKFTVIGKRDHVGMDTLIWTHVRDVFAGLQHSVKEACWYAALRSRESREDGSGRNRDSWAGEWPGLSNFKVEAEASICLARLGM